MDRYMGIMLGIGAALLWGTSGPVMRIADSMGISVLLVNLVRFVISSATLCLVAIFRNPGALRFSRGDIKPLVVLGACGMVMSSLGLNIAFLHLSVGLAMVIYYSAPCWIMAGSWLLGKDKPSRWEIGAFALAIVGVWVAVGGARSMGTLDLVGLLGALAGAFGYSFYVLNGKYGAGKKTPFRSFLHLYILAMFILWVFALARGESGALLRIPAKGWLVLIYLAFATSVAPYGLLVMSLKHIPGSVASIATMGEVPFSMMWAWIISSEKPEAAAVAGGVLVLLSVVVLALERPGAQSEEKI